MSPETSRATFSSLRARREAYHVASDILYEEPIDVRTVACQACGAWIDVHGSTITDPLHCFACGAKTPLPPYLRAKFMPRRQRPPKPLHYFAANDPLDDRPVFAEEPMDVPPWLIYFTVVLFPVGVGVGAAVLIWCFK